VDVASADVSSVVFALAVVPRAPEVVVAVAVVLSVTIVVNVLAVVVWVDVVAVVLVVVYAVDVADTVVAAVDDAIVMQISTSLGHLPSPELGGMQVITPLSLFLQSTRSAAEAPLRYPAHPHGVLASLKTADVRVAVVVLVFEVASAVVSCIVGEIVVISFVSSVDDETIVVVAVDTLAMQVSCSPGHLPSKALGGMHVITPFPTVLQNTASAAEAPLMYPAHPQAESTYKLP